MYSYYVLCDRMPFLAANKHCARYLGISPEVVALPEPNADGSFSEEQYAQVEAQVALDINRVLLVVDTEDQDNFAEIRDTLCFPPKWSRQENEFNFDCKELPFYAQGDFYGSPWVGLAYNFMVQVQDACTGTAQHVVAKEQREFLTQLGSSLQTFNLLYYDNSRAQFLGLSLKYSTMCPGLWVLGIQENVTASLRNPRSGPKTSVFFSQDFYQFKALFEPSAKKLKRRHEPLFATLNVPEQMRELLSSLIKPDGLVDMELLQGITEQQKVVAEGRFIDVAALAATQRAIVERRAVSASNQDAELKLYELVHMTKLQLVTRKRQPILAGLQKIISLVNAIDPQATGPLAKLERGIKRGIMFWVGSGMLALSGMGAGAIGALVLFKLLIVGLTLPFFASTVFVGVVGIIGLTLLMVHQYQQLRHRTINSLRQQLDALVTKMPPELAATTLPQPIHDEARVCEATVSPEDAASCSHSGQNLLP